MSFFRRGPLSRHDYLAMDRLPGLDGLRALAALAVVFFHFGGAGWDRLQGWLGVQLFFVLSGFLITTLALREERRRGSLSLRGFYLRRAFRILPVYLGLLALTTIATLIGGQFTSSRLADALPFYLSFGNELVDYHTPFGISWSLGVEEKFYLVWPLLLVVTARSRPGVRIIAVLTLIGGLLGATAWTTLTVHYASILIGCLLALVLDHPVGFGVLRPLTRPVVAVVLAAGFVALQLVGIAPLRTMLGGTWQALVPPYALGVTLLLIAAMSPGPVRWLLSRRPMAYLGSRSYSLYLSQTIAASVTSTVLPDDGTVRAVAVSLVALGMAELLHRWVETPAISCGRRLAQPPVSAEHRADARARISAG